MPSSHHQRQHFGAVGDAVAEVAAIGDEVNLRHRHRDAAGKAGENQKHEQHSRRNADVGPRRRGRRLRFVEHRRGWPAAHRQGQRQDRRGDDEADARISPRQPMSGIGEAHQQRPNRAGEVIAGRDNDHREPAPLDEPMGNIRHHRPEAGPRANSDQHVSGREYQEVRRISGENEAQTQARAGDGHAATTMPRRSVIRPSAIVLKASVHIIAV